MAIVDFFMLSEVICLDIVRLKYLKSSLVAWRPLLKQSQSTAVFLYYVNNWIDLFFCILTSLHLFLRGVHGGGYGIFKGR